MKIWDLQEGKLIANEDTRCDPSKFQNFYYTSKEFSKIGKYKAVLKAANGRVFIRDFEITGFKTNYEPLAPNALFVYNSWEDLNHNGKHERNEFSGLGKKVFNLDKEFLRVGLNVPNVTGEVIFRSYTENRELLGTTINPLQRIVKGHWTGPDAPSSSPPDFIDKVKEHGPGKYTITVSFKNDPSENYYVDFEIIK